MTNVIQFPKKQKRLPPLPRHRVFYLGYRYAGPMLCQEIQHVYLKRKSIVDGVRWWSMITYGKYDDDNCRTYSIELEECEENDVPDMLTRFDMDEEVTFAELEDMGWRGKIMYSAEIIQLSQLKED